jgi:hypothetical protein
MSETIIAGDGGHRNGHRPTEDELADSNLLLQGALLAARAGFKVFPIFETDGPVCACGDPECTDQGKHPTKANWQGRATRDEVQIRKWWAAQPKRNIGALTGAAGGIWAVDVEVRDGEDGRETILELEREHGLLPDTVEAITGSGGTHLIYAYPDRDWYVPNGVKVLPGVDVRGEGGYIVIAPSIHKSGRRYSWDVDRHPDDVQLAGAPEWLLKVVGAYRMVAAVAWGTSRGAGTPNVAGAEIPEGKRNRTLASLAGSMRNRGMEEDEILAALLVTNNNRCKPPLREDDVLRIAASIAKYEPDDDGATFSPAGKGTAAAPEDKDAVGGQDTHAGAGVVRQDILEKYPHWKPSVLSELSSQGAAIPWDWGAYMAPGQITSLTALWKIGKTTFVSYLVRAFGATSPGDGLGAPDARPEFCSQPIRIGRRVLIISEESKERWAARREELGLGDHIAVIARPFLGRPSPREWVMFIGYVGKLALQDSYNVVIFDTMHNLWCVDNENDASQVIAAMTPLYLITAAGAAVLMTFHPGKVDTQEGRLTRGSGSVGGFADIILEMRRYDASRVDDTRRTITAYSRWEETLPELVVELDMDAREYRLVGTKAHASAVERLTVIKDILPREGPGITPGQVCQGWPLDCGITKPGEKTIKRALDAAITFGDTPGVKATGKGISNDPLRYWLRGHEN